MLMRNKNVRVAYGLVSLILAIALLPREAISAPAATPSAQQWPLPKPTDLELAQARNLTSGVFKSTYADLAKSDDAAAHAAFGRRLLEQAIMADDDPAMRYVVLEESIGYLAVGGEVATAMSAVGRWQATFDVPQVQLCRMAIEVLKTGNRSATSPAASAELAQAYILLLESLSVKGEAEWWKQTVAAARIAQPRLKNPLLAALLARAAPAAKPAGATLLQPGLLADVYRDSSFNLRVAVRIDRQISFEWPQPTPDPHVNIERYSFCWQGYLKAPRAGEYELEVAADDGVIIRLDDVDVVSEWHGARGPYHAKASLKGSPQLLHVLYNNTGGKGAIKLSWKPPGAEKAVPIPADAFWHDAEWPWGQTMSSAGVHPADAVAGPAKGALPACWYKLSTTTLPWHAAERRCRQLGGHLAWVRGMDQRDALRTLAGNSFKYAGATDEIMERRWEWSNGQRVDPELFDFAEKEPNGGRDENYLAIRADGWSDSNGGQPFICQWDR
jgi:hypothetical protein